MSAGSGNWLVRGGVVLAALVGVLPMRAAAQSDPLATAVADIQQAIRMWDLDGMTNGAARLEALPEPGDAEAAYWTSYWRGIALLHAVFHVRERQQRTEGANREAELRLEALAALEQAVALREDCADAHAAIAVLYGMSIQAGNWLTALKLGPRLMRHKKLSERAASNPRVAYLSVVSELRSGRQGKRLVPAREKLRQAVEDFERERARPAADIYQPRWGYDHALMFMGRICAELGDVADSERWFARANSVNPNLSANREQRK